MEDAPLPVSVTPKEIISESFKINQDKNIYKLNIEIINQDIILNLLDENELMKEYEIKLTLEELKQIHKIFLILSSCKEFLDYIKAIIENNKLSVKKSMENIITIELAVEYLFKQNIIKIDLFKKKVNFELIAQDLYKKVSALTENFKTFEINYQKIVEENKNINEKNIALTEENKAIKDENKKIKEENKNIMEKVNNLENLIKIFNKEINELKFKNDSDIKNKKIILHNYIDSSILETQNEFDMIISTINERMNKRVKEIKKIYQATTDGGEPEIFHKKCDNIPNTLILYKTAGNRRFGAFASESWKSDNKSKLDKNCFLFSLDKSKFYFPKDNKYYQLSNYSYDGPSFCIKDIYCINIRENAINNSSLKTYEEYNKDFFNKDENALSEDGQYKGIFAKEYEVFQIIF